MKKVHFIGIAGTGMAATADLLLQAGWVVSGSDEGFYPPISTYLETKDMQFFSSYAEKNIPDDVDMIVIGKHAKLVAEENEEVKAAFASGKPIKSFPEVIQEVSQNTKNFVVAGSFGKSTCTALTTWTLSHAGKDPSYFVPALVPDLPDLGHHGKGGFFVLEGDEYPAANWDDQSKFMYYNATTLLLTSCAHDHINVFPTIESYLAPFVKLLKSLPSEAIIMACREGENIDTALKESGRTAVLYSLDNPMADWWAETITRGDKTEFDLMHKGEKVVRLSSHMLGDHNISNMVGVAAWLLENKAVTPDEVAAGFAAFRGVRRRLELRTTNTTVPVYEDFGSSPAKLTAGLTTIRQQFPHKKIHLVFEPHTFSFRNRAALEWYDTLFAPADVVYIYQPPTHGAGSHDQLTQQEIVDRVAANGKEVYAVTSKDDLMAKLESLVGGDAVILIETSGELGGSIEPIVDFAHKHFAK